MGAGTRIGQVTTSRLFAKGGLIPRCVAKSVANKDDSIYSEVVSITFHNNRQAAVLAPISTPVTDTDVSEFGADFDESFG